MSTIFKIYPIYFIAPLICQWRSTNWNIRGNSGSVHFLNRHSLSCNEGTAMNYFRLEIVTVLMRYKYRCCTTQLTCNNKRKETGFEDDGGGNATLLGRHNVQCDKQYINKFKLESNANKIQYSYTCCEMPDEKTCVDGNTPWNDDGKGHNTYLDRHEVKCKDNNAFLSQFKLVTSEKKYRYQYTCCRTNATSMPSPSGAGQ